MEINSYRKSFNKLTYYKMPVSISAENIFSRTNQLLKIQNRTLDLNELFSSKRFNHKKKIRSQNISLKKNASLINLPGIVNNDLLKKKDLFEPKIKTSRNIPIIKKINIKSKSLEKNKNPNLLFFDSSIKPLYEDYKILENNKVYQEQKLMKKNELNFDYDEKNQYIKQNSFSGNNPNILKNKVMFVKNIFDYMYPKIVINRMKFIDKQKISEIKYKVNILTKKFRNKYYLKKYKSAEENSAFSKYNLKGAPHDEAIKIKGNFINCKKIMINGHLMTQLAKKYDYINNL